MNISGQCHCGAISFTAVVDPAKVFVCHCADCQTFSGAPFRAVVQAPIADVVLRGEAKQYVKVAASGNRRVQAFCGDCGTQLYAAEPESPNVLNFRLGCINERSQLSPAAQLWADSAMPWLKGLARLPARAQGPASPAVDSPLGGGAL